MGTAPQTTEYGLAADLREHFGHDTTILPAQLCLRDAHIRALEFAAFQKDAYAVSARFQLQSLEAHGAAMLSAIQTYASKGDAFAYSSPIEALFAGHHVPNAMALEAVFRPPVDLPLSVPIELNVNGSSVFVIMTIPVLGDGRLSSMIGVDIEAVLQMVRERSAAMFLPPSSDLIRPDVLDVVRAEDNLQIWRDQIGLTEVGWLYLDPHGFRPSRTQLVIIPDE